MKRSHQNSELCHAMSCDDHVTHHLPIERCGPGLPPPSVRVGIMKQWLLGARMVLLYPSLHLVSVCSVCDGVTV